MINKEQLESQKAKLFQESIREEEEFSALIPNTGFFAEYMKYTANQESPGSYHFWVACTLISGILKRRCWVSKGIYNVYPNIYMIVVAKSGRCRKSRALSIGAELIQDFDFVNFIADKTTPESLLEALMLGQQEKDSEKDDSVNMLLDHTGFIHAGELAVFINKQTYTAEMVKILTHMYDCPPDFQYRTRNKRSIILEKPAITFMGASTPEWLASSLPEEAFEGGFMSRVIFVFKDYKSRRIALPMEPPQELRTKLRKMLMYIHKNFRGKMVLTDGARKWFVKWYETLDTGDVEQSMMEGFYERKPDTILKVALFLTAAENPEAKEITVDKLIQAEKIVSWTQERMFRSFSSVDISRLGKIRIKVKELVDANMEISRRQVLRRLASTISSVRELEEVEKIMVEAGELEVKTAIPEGGGRQMTIYVSKTTVEDMI